MKPATLGLFTFLASFLIYNIVGFLLAGVFSSNSIGFENQVYDYEAAISVSLVAAIVTGYVAWLFERD